MKAYNYFLLLVISLVIFSCESKTKKIQSNSPNGKTMIQIAGTKDGIGPWNLEIQVSKGNQSSKIETEMHADDLTNENVKFNWNGDSKCIITLIEQDGVTREIPIIY